LTYVTRIRPEKEELVSQLKDWLEASISVVFFSFEGLTSKDMQAMRADLKKDNLLVKVIKNSLLELALKDRGLTVDGSLFKGTTAILLSNTDELAAFKAFADQAKKHEALKPKGGILEGRWVAASEVDAVAALPGRQELYAQVVGAVASPIRGLVTVLSGPYRNLVYALQAVKEKKEQAA
jgi:large subunit ribosomal protein L10